jgi:hypothetical protein
VLALGACEHKPKPPDRTEPWLASAHASASSSPLSRRVQYRLVKSRIEFELPGKQAAPRGRFLRARGELDVDLDDLSHTTGSVSLDLTTLEMREGTEQLDAPSTARALEWLELGTGIALEKRDSFRDVTFQLGALDAGHLVAAPGESRAGKRRELVSNWSVRGELSLHGVRAPQTADVALTLVPGPDPAGPPAELLIRSRRPLVVVLGTHDIRPRNARGVLVAKDQAVLGDQVGREARVTFDFSFTPRS